MADSSIVVYLFNVIYAFSLKHFEGISCLFSPSRLRFDLNIHSHTEGSKEALVQGVEIAARRRGTISRTKGVSPFVRPSNPLVRLSC